MATRTVTAPPISPIDQATSPPTLPGTVHQSETIVSPGGRELVYMVGLGLVMAPPISPIDQATSPPPTLPGTVHQPETIVSPGGGHMVGIQSTPLGHAPPMDFKWLLAAFCGF